MVAASIGLGICSAWLAWCFVVFPGMVLVAARFWGRPPSRERPAGGQNPRVALVISAFNEAEVIEAKLANAIALDFDGVLDIWVSSDGSTDATAQKAASVATGNPRVRVLEYLDNRGKTAALLETISRIRATYDIIVFSDANGLYGSDAVARLVAVFADPTVGCVAGELKYSGSSGESTYRRFENRLRHAESLLGWCVGAEGSIYAARSELIPTFDTTLVDDLTIPLTIAANGHRVAYDPDAVSYEPFGLSPSRSIRRRARIVNRAFRSTLSVRGALNPFRNPGLAFALWSHRIMRWLSPAVIAIALALLLTYLASPYPFRWVGLAAFAGAVAVGLAGFAASRGVTVAPARYSLFFLTASAGVLLGLFSLLRGHRSTRWQPVGR
jgi:cellulose synthase/poly-beta-1,6-N-acetylglucosamine synthase-like glycosyltransferase